MAFTRGPLAAVAHTGISLGVAPGAHVIFSPAAVVVQDYVPVTVPWDEIAGMNVRVPVSGWPIPRMGDYVAPLMANLAHLSTGRDDSNWLYFSLTVAGRAEQTWQLASHHRTGYRRSVAARAAEVIRQLAGDPALRPRLEEPESLLQQLWQLPRKVTN